MRGLFRVALVAIGALVGAALGPVIPVAKLPISGVAQADWVRYELPAPTMIGDKLWPAGTEVCKDKTTGILYPASPYESKKAASQATALCTGMAPFLAWLGTAEAASLRFSLATNVDGSRDTTYPTGNKPPTGASIAWSDTCLATALAIASNQSTATTTSINIDTGGGCFSGTNAAAATITFVQASDNTTSCAAQWSITGASPNRALTDSSPTAASGSCKLKATYMGNSALSNAYPWAYQAPPATDTLAPPIPTDLRTTAGSGTVTITGDTPWDACGNAVCKGTKQVKIQKDGSGTLATVAVGPGFSGSPTLTNIGAMSTTPASTQTGNDWSISGAGTMDGAADAYAFENWAFSGAGFMVAIFNDLPAATTNYQKLVLAAREGQSVVGSKAIIAGIERENIADGGNQDFFVDARLTTDGLRGHASGAIRVTPPIAVKMERDVSGNWTVSTASVTAGKANNDWVAQLSSYSLPMSGTNYFGLGMSSGAGSSGANTTGSISQLNINNQARWTYTENPASGTHTYAALGEDLETVANASAYSPTVSGTPSAGGGAAALKWHIGPYFDCSIENRAGDAHLALGNAVYATIKSCIDFAAAQTNVKGVFVLVNWTSLEGATLGCYSSTCSNALGSAGTIGFPLIDDLLTYAAANGQKVILGLQWGINYYDNCGNGAWDPVHSFPAYLVQSSCSGGTDAAGTYGITLDSTNVFIYARLWKQAVMDRLIALMQAYGTRYDTNSALEKFIVFEQDPAFTAPVPYPDGFTWAGLEAQAARLPPAVRPYWLHTNLGMQANWFTPSGEQTIIAALATSYFSVDMNNSIVWQTTYGENTYLGRGTVGGQSFGTHDYRNEIPFGTWTAGPEQCALWDSYAARNGLSASSNTTPQQFYDTYMTNGKSDSAGLPLKPSWWIFGRVQASQSCPAVANQQWGTIASGGFYQMIQTNALKSTCPSNYPGGCNTN